MEDDLLLYEQLTDKYRPKTLAEVYGQQNIKQILSGMFDSKRIAPTYLITGPHSTGKTTLSRIIARHVNCQKGPKVACGECSSCKAMDKGTHPDVIELDAASNRGIDQIRELIQRSSLAPMVGKKKVFIVDECYPGNTLVLIDYETAVPIKQVVNNPEQFPKVLAYDLEKKKIVQKEIINRYSRPYSGKMIRLKVGGGDILCTERQEIYVVGKGYTPACDITCEDKLISYHGSFQKKHLCSRCGALLPPRKMSSHVMKSHYEETTHHKACLEATTVCKYCGKEIDLTEYRPHLSTMHPKECGYYEAMNQESYCPFCHNRIKVKDLGKHYVQNHYEQTSHVAYTESRIGSSQSDETKKKVQQGLVAFHKTEAGAKQRKEQSERQQGCNNTIFRYMTPSEFSAHFSKGQRKWGKSLSSEERNNRIKTFINAPKYNHLPNKVESSIIAWNVDGLKYVGDGSLFLTLPFPDGSKKKKNPDFIYKEEGKVKKVIEVMDFEYWHTKEEAKSITKAYATIGYPCLVLDAARLSSSPGEVQGEIEAFCNNHIVDVEDISSFEYKKDMMVYDLEVQDTHNFFVVSGNYDYGHHGCTEPKTPILSSNCHALTGNAAEAFLKTLEEPSKSTIFILCTTDPGKLKKTIRSRTRWFKLQALKKEECAALLQDVSQKEGVPLQPEHAAQIAQYAYGHPREALHLLENVIDFFASEGEVEDINSVIESVVKKALQMTPEMMAETYVEAILQGASDYAYRILEDIDNAPYFLERVCYIFRQNLMVATGSIKCVDDYYSRWFIGKKWTRRFGSNELLTLYKKHLEAMNIASTYTMNPDELLMKTAIEGLLLMRAQPANRS